MNTNNWSLPKFKLSEFAPKKTKYCIGIPVINEGKKFTNQLQQMKKYSQLVDILIFDGGSTDGSTDSGFLKKQSVRTLLILKSPGKQGTQLRMGLAYALKEGYEGIITIDGNGKDGVDAIPLFIEALDRGYDLTAGSRFIKGGQAVNTPLGRLLGIRFIHAPLISLSAKRWYTDTTNGFKAYSKRYLLNPRVQPFRNIFVGYELLFYLTVRASQLGFKTKEIPVTRAYPKNKIPTKIAGLWNNANVAITALKVLLQYYHPKKVSSE